MDNPHDKFFKKSMRRKELALDFLNYYLPQELLAKIDMDTLEIEKDSFIDDELKEHFSDMVYKAQLGEQEAYLCFLLEHKSYPYSNITLQLLRYMLNIWNLKIEQKEELPLIVPMLIYHGKETWNIGLNLSDIIEEIPLEAEEYLPDFRYILFDLSGYKKEDIKNAALLRVFSDILSAVKPDNKEDFEDKLLDATRILTKLEEEDRTVNYFAVIIIYLLEADISGVNQEDIERIIEKASKEKGEEVMSIAEELKEEAKKEERKKLAKNLLKEGVEVDIIKRSVELSKEEIKELQKGMKH